MVSLVPTNSMNILSFDFHNFISDILFRSIWHQFLVDGPCRAFDSVRYSKIVIQTANEKRIDTIFNHLHLIHR